MARRPVPVRQGARGAGAWAGAPGRRWGLRALAGLLAGTLLAAATVGAAPSRAQAAPIVLVDDIGQTVTLQKSAQRIVSLLPSLTETVCALDACARLVGTDRYSNWPAQVAALPKLGGLDDLQVERIVALRPDVVLAAKSQRINDRLRALGLQVLVFDSQSHADVRRALHTVAQVLGTPPAGARVWAGIETALTAAAQRVPARRRGQRVYFEVASTPHAAGPTSFIGETLTRLGLGNIVPAALGPFPQLNPEFIVRARPDIVMGPARDVAGMAQRPGWAGIAATPDQRCSFDAATYELLVRPGPRMGDAARTMADCVAALDAPAQPRH